MLEKLFGAPPLHNSPVDHIFIYEAKGSSADLSQGREAAHDVEEEQKGSGVGIHGIQERVQLWSLPYILIFFS